MLKVFVFRQFHVAQAGPGLLILLSSHTQFMWFRAWSVALHLCQASPPPADPYLHLTH